MEKELIEVQKYFKDAYIIGSKLIGFIKDYEIILEKTDNGYFFLCVGEYPFAQSKNFSEILAVLKAISDIGSK